jgi:hypothetical protein
MKIFEYWRRIVSKNKRSIRETEYSLFDEKAAGDSTKPQTGQVQGNPAA